jgi:putative peptidoglycan lipid II flippase
MMQIFFRTRQRLWNLMKTMGEDSSQNSVNRQIFGAALLIGGLTLTVHLVAMTKELIIASWFGTGDALDAYLISLVIPTFVINVIAGSFHSALLPTYVQVRDEEGRDKAGEIFSTIMTYCITFLLLVTFILVFLGPFVLPLLASGFDSQKLALTRILYYCLLPIILIQGIITIGSAVLNAGRRFALAAIVPALTPMGIMIALIANGSNWGIYSLVVGTLVGFISQAFIIGLGLKKQGIRLWPRLVKENPHLRKVMKQYGFIVAGSFLMSSTTLVDQGMAAVLKPGSVSTLNYGTRLVSLGLALSVVSLGTAIFPFFSRQVTQKDWSTLSGTFHQYLRWIFVIGILISVFVFLLSEPIIRFIFERGVFSAEDTHRVAEVQAAFSLQIPFHVGGILAVRIVSSLKKNHFLIWASGFNLFLKVVLNYLFIKWLGVAGIALSTSCMYLGSFTLVYIFIRTSFRNLIGKDAPLHGSR